MATNRRQSQRKQGGESRQTDLNPLKLPPDTRKRPTGWMERRGGRPRDRGVSNAAPKRTTLLDGAAELSRAEHFPSEVVQPEAQSELVEPRRWLHAAS